MRTSWRVVHPGSLVAVAVLLLAGCGDLDTGGPVVTSEVTLRYAGPPSPVDSVGAATEGGRFELVGNEEDDPPVPGVRVEFRVAGEGCGEVAGPGAVVTDDDGVAAAPWTLGDIPGVCQLDATALTPSGGVLAVASALVEVVPGQVDELWLAPGSTLAGQGVLDASAPGRYAVDRVGNDVPWRFRVLEGPLQAGSDVIGSVGARILSPTGLGRGLVALESRWGAFAEMRVSVCDVGGATEIRLYRPTGPADTGPGCG